MKAYRLYEAMNEIDDDTARKTAEAYCGGEKAAGHRVRGSFRTVLIAAVMVSVFAALGAAAYAGDFLGIRSLLGGAPDGTDGSPVSLTAPQELPEDVPEKVPELVENSRRAWEEWQEYKENESDVRMPGALENAPEDYTYIDERENPDGSVTVSYISADYDEKHEEYTGEKVLMSAVLSAEEHESWKKINEAYRFGDFDPAYGVMSERDGDRLTETAEKYGLKLRRAGKVYWSSETAGMTGDNFLTDRELANLTSAAGCAGNIFYKTPSGFDKLYWFDEGSFGVSWYMALPSCGEEVTCYGRNSMYSTLSSGSELGDAVRDPNAFKERRHTAPDGTELTVLTDGRDAYIYVYLENSYFVMSVNVNPRLVNEEDRSAGVRMTDADLDFIADSLNYSLIGR